MPKDFERKCVICGRNHLNGRMLGPLIHLTQISAHFNCVLFSPVTPDSLSRREGSDGGSISGVSTRFIRIEAQRAKKLTCNYCHAIGANAGCCYDTGTDLVVKFCSKKYHIDCGMSAGASFTVSKDRGTVSICYNHRDAIERAPENPPKFVTSDDAAGNESDNGLDAVTEAFEEYDVGSIDATANVMEIIDEENDIGLDRAAGRFEDLDAGLNVAAAHVIEIIDDEDDVGLDQAAGGLPKYDDGLNDAAAHEIKIIDEKNNVGLDQAAREFKEYDVGLNNAAADVIEIFDDEDDVGLDQAVGGLPEYDDGLNDAAAAEIETVFLVSSEIKDIADLAEDPLRDGSLAAIFFEYDEGECSESDHKPDKEPKMAIDEEFNLAMRNVSLDTNDQNESNQSDCMESCAFIVLTGADAE